MGLNFTRSISPILWNLSSSFQFESCSRSMLISIAGFLGIGSPWIPLEKASMSFYRPATLKPVNVHLPTIRAKPCPQVISTSLSQSSPRSSRRRPSKRKSSPSSPPVLSSRLLQARSTCSHFASKIYRSALPMPCGLTSPDHPHRMVSLWPSGCSRPDWSWAHHCGCRSHRSSRMPARINKVTSSTVPLSSSKQH